MVHPSNHFGAMLRATRLLAVALAGALLLSAAASAARSSAAASAGRYGPFTGCPRRFDGTKHVGAMYVSKVGARHLSCGSAYRLIENFPADGLEGGIRYRGYRCTDTFAPPASFRIVCTDGAKAFRFTGEGE